jgi:hypothetical protein
MTFEDDDPATGGRDDSDASASASLPPMTAMTPVDRAWAAPAAAQRFAPGEKVFGKYRVVRKLGQGGMGEVWLVRKEGLDCDRALKLIDPRHAASPQAREWFYREARSMARIEHPGAVRVHHYDVEAGEPYIELEYVAGQSLDQFLTPGRAMPQQWIGPVLEQLCDVLGEAHRRRVVHRDLKPANLLLVAGRPPGKDLKVLDFGIAKLLEPGEGLTIPGQFVGSPGYASPEQLRGGPVDHRTDLYAVGVLLYRFLTGRQPAAAAAPRPPGWPWTPHGSAAAGDYVPAAIRDLVRRCLSEDPGRRPQSAAELYELYREALAKPRGSASRGHRRRRRAIAGAALTGAAGLGLAFAIAPGRPWKRADPGGASITATEARRLPPAPSRVVGASAVALRDSRSLGTQVLLATILEDARALGPAACRGVRYVSWNHRLAAGATAAELDAARRRLEAAMRRVAGRHVSLHTVSTSAGIDRVDLASAGWDVRPFRVVGPDQEDRGPSPINLHDLILLEYPAGWVESVPERRALEDAYLVPAGLVRPLAYVRGDWLTDVLERSPLADELRAALHLPPVGPEATAPTQSPTIDEAGAAAELGFPDIASFRRARAAHSGSGDALKALDALSQGRSLPRHEWDRIVPRVVAELALGEPVVPIDSLDHSDRDAASGPVAVVPGVNKRVFRPADVDHLVITLENRSEAPAYAEWVGVGDAGNVVYPEPGDVGFLVLPPGGFRKFGPYPIGAKPGKDRVVVFAAATPLEGGTKLRAGDRERFVHLGAFPTARITRRVVEFETREP